MSKTKESIPEQKEVDDSGYEEVRTCLMEDPCGKIYGKLLEFQKLGISLSKDATNPHFKNSYADLNETLKKVKGPLNELGVLILQETSEIGLNTRLYCPEDNSETSCFLPWIDGANAQKRGSEITYFRRYALKTLLALDDMDDDGEKASESKVGEAVRNLAEGKAIESHIGGNYQEDDLNF